MSLPGYNLLIDAPPDIRDMINRYEIRNLHGIFATCASYDHIGGIREFEYWGDRLDFLAEESLFKLIHEDHWTERLRDVFFHIPYYPGAALYFGKFSILPFAVRRHVPIFGMSIKVKGRRIVYTSDTPNQLTHYACQLMRWADLLIVNTPTFEPPKEDHITVIEALRLKEKIGVPRMILTYINHRNKPHDELVEYVSQFPGVMVAYDGMEVEV